MKYHLSQFIDLPETTLISLREAGIHTTDDLLNAGDTPTRREQLSKTTGLSLAEIVKWTGVSDLVRVKGIGSKLASFLVGKGIVRNIQGLVLTFGTQKTNEAIIQLVKKNGISLNRMVEVAAEARELRPRLIFHDLPYENMVKSHINRKIEDGRVFTRKLMGVCLVFISLLLVLVFLPWLVKLMAVEVDYRNAIAILRDAGMEAYAAGSDPINIARKIQHVDIFSHITSNLLLYFLISLCVAALLVYGYIFFIFSSVLFDRYVYRTSLYIIDEQLLDETHKNYFMEWLYRYTKYIVATIILIFCIILLFPENLREISGLYFLNIISVFFTLFFIYLAIVSIKRWKSLKKMNQLKGEMILFNTFRSSYYILVVVVLVYLSINISPVFLKLHYTLDRRFAYSYLVEEVGDIQKDLEHKIEQSDEPAKTAYNDLLDSVSQGIAQFLEKGCVNCYVIKDFGGPLWNAIMRLLLVIFVSLIVFMTIDISIAYTFFIKWQTGVVYVFIIIMSPTLEYLFTKQATFIGSTLNIGWATTILSGLLIIAIAFILDWLFDIYSLPQKRCMECNQMIEISSVYCPTCGIHQPS